MTPGLKNWQLFATDPRSFTLMNDGVTKVRSIGAISDDYDWKVLRHELETFVCDGGYREGLERILTTFLANIDHPTQPAVWVSGFFGSGKSHFVRVLEALWLDPAFPDGATARGIANLEGETPDLLREITIAGKREGGLWAASGMVNESQNQSFALALLGIVFQSAGLSPNYGQARFQLWLRQQGWEATIRERLAAQSKSFDNEIEHYLVSTALSSVLLELDPNLAATPSAMLDRLENQFPDVSDIHPDRLVAAIDDVLALQSTKPGRRPLTLIILDEMQQYIGTDTHRSLAVQQAVEAIQSRFAGHVMLIATGQAALNDTDNLQKLQGRFTGKVMLSDADVEEVVRKVVLKKDPAQKETLDALIDGAAGEIDRQLRQARIGPKPEDRPLLNADYPLLPARRRLWEHLLRAVDETRTSGQLRNQLRVTLEATKGVADDPAGVVIPGDVLFDQLQQPMVQSGKLPTEIWRLISEFKSAPGDELKARICGLVFLLNQLNRDKSFTDTGVRATVETLADLLVSDLTSGSAALRADVEKTLAKLEEDGNLLRSATGEYSIQTGESLQWEQEFGHYARVTENDPLRIEEIRGGALKKLVGEELKKLSTVQGSAKEPRKVTVGYGEAPAIDASHIGVWVRDGWNTDIQTVIADARQYGEANPTIFIFLPNPGRDDLRAVIARAEAAELALNARGVPSTADGQAARSNMENRKASESHRRDQIIAGVLREARVFQGGGNEISADSPGQAIQTAFDASLIRMYPKFAEADHKEWGDVFKRAKGGAADALQKVGYSGDPLEHPIVKEIFAFIGGEPGKSWADIRNRYLAAPFGWPRDAIDSAVALLVLTGAVKVRKNGVAAQLADLNQQQPSSFQFIGEATPMTKSEMIALRSLLSSLGVTAKDDQAVRTLAPTAIAQLIDQARRAGGDAPLPVSMPPAWLTDLQALTGNQQLKAMLDAKQQLIDAHKRWAEREQAIAIRLPRWKTFKQLQAQAASLPVAAEIAPAVAAIEQGRQLLDEPDPVDDLRKKVAAALRAALQERGNAISDRFQAEMLTLEGTSEWTMLQPGQRQQVIAASGLRDYTPPPVQNDDELLKALTTEPLAWLDQQRDALPGRFSQAHAQAAKLLEPDVIPLAIDKPLLRSEADLDAWLAKLRDDIAATIQGGNPVKVV